MDSTLFGGMETSLLSTMEGITLADRLRLAASRGQEQAVRDLVAAGASLEPDRENRTALHYASICGSAPVVTYLLSRGCDIDAQDDMGYTSLHRAAAQGHLNVVQALIQHGCSLNKQDDVHGNSALHQAAWNGYSQTLDLLIKQKCNVNVINKAGFSSLHLAAQNGHNQCARLLLYAGCNCNFRNNYGDTAVHTAARYGHAGVTRILLSARCNVNVQNKNGDTALHISSALKRRKIAKLLMDVGVDVSIKNKQNETAIDVAKRKAHPEIVVIITSQPAKPQKKRKLSKRFGKKKLSSGESGTDSDRKSEKHGFFFRKKAKKSKDSEKQAEKFSMASTGTSAAGGPPLPARQPHMQPEPHNPVRGLLNKYMPQQGVQYYRDLAGNVRQGPIGYAPVCTCGPQFKKLEQKMEADRANLYDHVDATQQLLSHQLQDLGRHTQQQMETVQRHSHEQMLQQRQEVDQCIHRRALQERFITDRHQQIQYNSLQRDMHRWVASTQPAQPAPAPRHVQQAGRMGYHGAIYRSRSDETLSSHNPDRRHRKHGMKARPRVEDDLYVLDKPDIRTSPLGEVCVDGRKQTACMASRSPDGMSGTDAASFQEPIPITPSSHLHAEISSLRLTDDGIGLSHSEAKLNTHAGSYITSTPNCGNTPEQGVPYPSPVLATPTSLSGAGSSRLYDSGRTGSLQGLSYQLSGPLTSPMSMSEEEWLQPGKLPSKDTNTHSHLEISPHATQV